MQPTRRALLRASLSLGIAAVAWPPAVHLLFEPAAADLEGSGPLSAWGRGLLEAVLRRAESGDHLPHVRRLNPEWDLIERMVASLALANVALRDTTQRGRVERVLGDTSRQLESAIAMHGQGHYLLPYGRRGGWKGSGRSLFVDGEVAVVHGARLLLGDDREIRGAFRRRVERVRAAMAAGPVLCAESYPDECWTFCNTAGLVALRMAEVLDGADHRSLRAAWVEMARSRLVDADTGLLASAFTLDGRATQPPEGSSLWWSAHALRLVDDGFAREQYARSVQALTRRLLGFAWAAEWPARVDRQLDIDSGAVVPVLDASPASSGWALVAARSFGDRELQRNLLASVGLAGFPELAHGEMRLRTGNPVGDAILLYSLVQGPLWQALGARTEVP